MNKCPDYGFRLAGRFLPITLLLAMVTACAMSGPGIGVNEPAEDAAVAAIPVQPPLQAQELTDDLMFDILLGEIAGQRGVMEISVPHYLQAAMDARDPRVAERAVQIASFAEQYDTAYKAAERWVALDGDNIEAHKTLMALALRTDNKEATRAQMDYLLRSSEDPEEGYKLATAILARETDKQAALTVMDELVTHHPDNAYAWLARARMAVLAEQLDEALDNVDRSLGLKPDLTTATILKAQILVRKARKDEATAVLKRAVSRYPDDEQLRFAYARMLLDADELAAAKDQFAAVVRLNPDNADALYSLGLLELEMKEYSRGEAHLKQLLGLGSREQNAYYYLGYAARQQGRDDEALDWYSMVETGEYWGQSQLHIAEIMVSEGRVAEMQEHLRVLRQKNPKRVVQFYMIEGQVLTGARMLDVAYQTYSEALEAFPDNEDLLYARALVAEKLGQISIAERDMRQILDNDPDNTRTLNALGYTLADRTDRYEEALKYIEMAYRQSPDDPAIIDSMGWVHYRLGNLEEARGHLKRAWEMTRDGEIGAHYGEVLWALGEKSEARRVWMESKESSPDNPVLLDVMQRYDQ